MLATQHVRVRRRLFFGTLVGSVVGWQVASVSAAVDPEDFVIASAADLVDVCSAPSDHELYIEAIHMCHGFISGAAQYALLLFEQSGAPYFCLPAQPPSRSEAIGEFVTWMGTHQEFAEGPAPEALARFLAARFPCE